MSLSPGSTSVGRGDLDIGPGRIAGDFALALLEGDADAATAHFASDARLLTPDGTEVAGNSAIAAVLAQLTGPTQRLEIRTGRTLRVEGVALATQYWTRISSAVGVKPFERSSTATLVLGRVQGCWRILIASPWGQ